MIRDNKLIPALAILLGLAAFSNGLLMTFFPEFWYWLVPGVSDRGPFNHHFVRDIGLNYLLIGLAFCAGSLLARHQLTLWLLPTAWLTGHALVHVWEVIVGICAASSLIQDFPGVTLPAIVALVLVFASYRSQSLS